MIFIDNFVLVILIIFLITLFWTFFIIIIINYISDKYMRIFFKEYDKRQKAKSIYKNRKKETK